MSNKQIPGSSQTSPTVDTTAPTGAAGVDMTLFDGAAKPDLWIVTAIVTVAPSDLFVWGCLAQGVANDETDDNWGLVNDRYHQVLNGKIGTALAVGTHHFLIKDIGVFQRVAFTRSAGAVAVKLTPVYAAGRGN